MRFAILALVALMATPAYSQITFHSSVDFEQNERLDSLESRTASIESSVARIESAVDRLATGQADSPKPVAKKSTPPKQPATPASNRYTQAELEAIYRQEFPSGYRVRYADVQPRSAVWSHLKSGQPHKFTSAQVDGLSQAAALAIHDLDHGGKLSPYRGSYRGQVQAVTNQVSRTVPQQNAGCANGQCANRSTIQSARRVRSPGLFRRLFRR